MQGHLVRVRIRVTRSALNASIHCVDHGGTVERWRHVVHRRVYSVAHPNALWHIDGQHKLIRWRFVIHAAVDGFSRTITYIKCADNNRAPTVLQLFSESVAQFGLPDQVRSDDGGENVGVWRYMISTHEGDETCVITGSSVHNERVERLWRDVHRCIVAVFSDIFQSLERGGTLDPTNEVDLYCLHHVFLPRINKSLAEFQESWNNHALSSEGRMTPYQLFFQGLDHAITHTGYELGTVNTDTEINVSEMTVDRVRVPRILFIPCDVLTQEISIIDSLQTCSDNGRSVYNRTIQTAGQHLSGGCSQCTVV